MTYKIDEVRARADIVEIVGAHVRLRRAGRNFVGLCPFHNEKTPSFSVNAGARIFSLLWMRRRRHGFQFHR